MLVSMLVIALLIVQTQNNLYKDELSSLRNQQFHDQLQEGKACGLLTAKEASKLLQEEVVLESGSIVPASSPTAATREGAPRIDGCSYVAPHSNGTYADVIIKTYDSSRVAGESFKKDTDKILFIVNKDVPEGSNVTAQRYSSGAHYTLIDNLVIEVSASRVGASAGSELEEFSKQVTNFVLEKL